MQEQEYLENAFREGSQGLSVDLDWIGTDGDGHLAFFSSGLLMADIPDKVFASFELFKLAHDAIDSLPGRGNAVWVVDKPPPELVKPQVCEKKAKCGLFVYDPCVGKNHYNPFATDGARQSPQDYGLMCIPTVPISLSQLPANVADYVSRIAFDDICFPDATSIVVST